MMLPPVDLTALSTNPRFETLYRDLCTNKLNPDGSSVLDDKVQKERDIFATVSGKCSAGIAHAIMLFLALYSPTLQTCACFENLDLLLTSDTQDLRIARLEGAKRNLIKLELRNIRVDSAALPDDVSS